MLMASEQCNRFGIEILQLLSIWNASGRALESLELIVVGGVGVIVVIVIVVATLESLGNLID